jgi:hypothetical protein
MRHFLLTFTRQAAGEDSGEFKYIQQFKPFRLGASGCCWSCASISRNLWRSMPMTTISKKQNHEPLVLSAVSVFCAFAMSSPHSSRIASRFSYIRDLSPGSIGSMRVTTAPALDAVVGSWLKQPVGGFFSPSLLRSCRAGQPRCAPCSAYAG